LKAHRIIAVAISSLTVALAMSAPAFAAYSSTLYPAGDAISASSVPVTVTGPGGFINDTCTLNGGAFTIPGANHNSAGPVTMNFTTLPTYTSCTGNVPLTITTTGAGVHWTFSAQYGQAATTVNIVPGGLIFNYLSQQCANQSAASFSGSWNNGFTSPVSVSSAIAYGGPITTNCGQFTFGVGLQTLTDTTHPASLSLLGP
jgi:hypothetical protein